MRLIGPLTLTNFSKLYHGLIIISKNIFPLQKISIGGDVLTLESIWTNVTDLCQVLLLIHQNFYAYLSTLTYGFNFSKTTIKR